MSEKLIKKLDDYKNFIIQIKNRIQSSQIKAAISVNEEMLKLYWVIGSDIVKKQETANWGDGLLKQISADLKQEFPDIKGFSHRNIKYMKQWFMFWTAENEIRQQVVAQLSKTIVEYALKDISKPIGISEYMLTKHLPEKYKNALPSIEEIESEIGGGDE